MTDPSPQHRKVSAYVIAYNEAEKLPATLASLSWADEVIVADSYSTDDTASIAQAHGAKVVQISFAGFGALRNEAVSHCAYEWVFSLDSDERCTPEVAEEIRAILNSESPCDAYLVPRRNRFMGRWIQHSGWYPNFRQPQFFRRDAMQYDSLPVHEGYVLAQGARLGRLQNAIWQIPFGHVGEVLRKADRYSSLGAAKIQLPRITIWTALRHATWAFLKHYIFKRGFLDGAPGFVIAFGNFEGTFYRYLKAMEQRAGGWK
jgi:glycosyltransferase involved in cell wall biosynthesis